MTHTRIQDTLPAFALDAVGPNERSQIERHLNQCADCRAEIDGFRAIAAELHTAVEAPPTSVWDRIEAAIVAGRDGDASLGDASLGDAGLGDAGLGDAGPGDAHLEDASRFDDRVVPLARRRRRVDLQWLAVAAVASLVIALGIQTNRLGQTQTDLAAAEARAVELETMLDAGLTEEVAIRAAASPDATTAVLAGSLGSGTIVILPDGTGFLVADDLPALGAEQTYQLWAVQDGQVISAGVLGSDPRVVAFHIDPDLLEGLVITAERAGGVPVSSQTEASAWFRDA